MIVVVLPQPDSPTRPSVSPSRMSKLMPSTARDRADPAAQDRALGQRVVLDQVADLEHGRPLLARDRPSRTVAIVGQREDRRAVDQARARSPRCGGRPRVRPPPAVRLERPARPSSQIVDAASGSAARTGSPAAAG